VDYLQSEHLIEVRGAGTVAKSSYRYAILQKGHARARELLKSGQYIGPAPVPIQTYIEQVKTQSIAGLTITDHDLRRALGHLVLDDDLINQLGPAVNSGKAVFIFGNTGNGKTTIGEAIGAALPGALWLPYVVSVDDQIIRLFDVRHHRPVEAKKESERHSGALRYLTSQSDRFDERWILIRRPLIIVGGELILKNLNLIYDPVMKLHEAPYQMKANGGVFLVDDLGRQRMLPRTLLNRWIVPLEKHIDSLALAGGQKIDIPFDTRVIFATNLQPEDLADEAFLRRIRYKIHIPDPTWAEFREIFKREAATREIPYSEEGVRYLIDEYYTKAGRQPRGVHPRDLLDSLVHVARFRGIPPKMTETLIDLACRPYFLKSEDSEA
jgi:predicted ATPase with chaperone activity